MLCLDKVDDSNGIKEEEDVTLWKSKKEIMPVLCQIMQVEETIATIIEQEKQKDMNKQKKHHKRILYIIICTAVVTLYLNQNILEYSNQSLLLHFFFLWVYLSLSDKKKNDRPQARARAVVPSS